MRQIIFALLLLTTLQVRAAELSPTSIPASGAGKTIEVCFVLDTTGSMSGLIEGAKRKIWTIANGIVAADKKAMVRFALVPYRDRGDEYVTKVFDLTDDLDKVFADLQTFAAAGGGDGPESVNQALDDAVNKVKWTPKDGALKFIFLVGDCPPHMDYPDDVKYPRTCELAARQNIIINTVQCGGESETTPIWREIAKLAEGSFVALEQSGGMAQINTPMDDEIAALSAKIGALAVPYGSASQQLSVASKNSAATSAPASVAAERAYFNGLSGKAIQGRGDLISDVREKAVALDKVDEKELPAQMQKMSLDERKDYLKTKGEERDKLTAQVNELSQKRQAYITEQTKKLAGRGDAFDEKVTEIVQGQMNRKK